jgi:hypothetical protein
LKIVGLSGGPRPVDQHIAGGPGIAARAIAVIEDKAGQAAHHVIGGGKLGTGEIALRIGENSVLGEGRAGGGQQPNHQHILEFSSVSGHFPGTLNMLY